MKELLPGFEKEAPLDADVSSKRPFTFSPARDTIKLPITPPPMRDHGNYVISINRFVKWLAGKVEEAGITVFTGFAGSELLYDGDRVSRRSDRRQRRGQAEPAEVEFRAGLRHQGKGRDPRRRARADRSPSNCSEV